MSMKILVLAMFALEIVFLVSVLVYVINNTKGVR